MALSENETLGGVVPGFVTDSDGRIAVVGEGGSAIGGFGAGGAMSAALDLGNSQAISGDQNWVFFGDSTGEADTEWIHKTMELYAAEYPNVGFSYSSWGGSAFASATSYQTAAANHPTVTFWNGSWAGTSFEYMIGSVLPKAIEKYPDLVFINAGHGESTLVDDPFTSRLLATIADMQEKMPQARIILVSQNAQISPASNAGPLQARRRNNMIWVAQNVGCGFLDVNKAFYDSADITSLIGSDGIHPNEAGSELWANVAFQGIRSGPAAATARNLVGIQSNSILLNSDFSTYTTSPGAPDDWTVSANTTAAKDTTNKEDGFSWGVRLTPTSTGGGVVRLQQSVSNYTQYRGRYVTTIARVYIPASGQGLTNGRIQILDGVNSTTWSWLATHEFVGRFVYLVARHKVATNAAQLTCYLIGDSGTGTATADVTFQWVCMVPDALPRGLAR